MHRYLPALENEDLLYEFHAVNSISLDSIQTGKQYVPGFDEVKPKSYYWLKRVLDIIFSLLSLLVLLPLFILVAIAIKLDSKGPVIFSQTRVGKRGQQFNILKFRSMIQGAEELLDDLREKNEVDGPVFKIREDPRLTRVGEIIRKSSIDELPQLINVLKGEMSLVGPRPPIPAEVEQYTPYQKQRIMVTPGITCYWQISGRSETTFDEWVELDLKYIRERTLWLDIYLVILTIPVVITGRGAY